MDSTILPTDCKSDFSENELLPNGDYHYEVVSADYGISDGGHTDGSKTLELKLAFFDDAGDSSQWTETFIFHPSCEWKISLFAKSANLLVDGKLPAHGAAIDFTKELVTGLRGVATVRAKPGQRDPSRKFNYVAAWLTKEKLPRAPRIAAADVPQDDGQARPTIILFPEVIESAEADSCKSADLSATDPVVEVLEQRAFDIGKEPPPLRPIYTLQKQVVATRANLQTITAAVKAGKSAVTENMAAAPMPHGCDADLLGFESANESQFALLWFDSEQSPYDHWRLVARALKRTGQSKPPPWFYSYCLTGLGYERGWECVESAIEQAADKHGGIHSVLLDGVADFVSDVNDAAESNDFVAGLHEMAIEYDCPITGVIHFNPGSDKSRGHLGSQLERKAESNLRLDKVNGVSTIWSDKQRGAPIPKEHGPRFQWDDATGMHVTVASRKDATDTAKLDESVNLVEAMFAKKKALQYTEIVKFFTAKNGLAVSTRTAARRITELSRLGFLEKSGGGLWIKGKM